MGLTALRPILSNTDAGHATDAGYSVIAQHDIFYLPSPADGRSFTVTNHDRAVTTVVDQRGRYHHLKPNEKRSF
jgi:hypothetical protein